MRDFEGRTAVVTGGASGIGFALAEAFARQGMNVVVADIEPHALDDAVTALRSHGGEVHGVETDVSRRDSVDALAAAAFERFGAVHVLCNNAGVAAGGPTWEVAEADWQWVLGVNLWGVIHGIRAFVPRMIAGGDEGHIVNTASMEGLLATPAFGPYAVSKFGVVAISETLHFDLQMHGSALHASVLCPGWVRTRIHQSERNRPADLTSEPVPGDPEREMLLEMGRAVIDRAIATGMAPADVAGKVVDAIREERFYILTHEDWMPMITGRMHDIVEGRNPSLSLPPGLADFGSDAPP